MSRRLVNLGNIVDGQPATQTTNKTIKYSRIHKISQEKHPRAARLLIQPNWFRRSMCPIAGLAVLESAELIACAPMSSTMQYVTTAHIDLSNMRLCVTQKCEVETNSFDVVYIFAKP